MGLKLPPMLCPSSTQILEDAPGSDCITCTSGVGHLCRGPSSWQLPRVAVRAALSAAPWLSAPHPHPCLCHCHPPPRVRCSAPVTRCRHLRLQQRCHELFRWRLPASGLRPRRGARPALAGAGARWGAVGPGGRSRGAWRPRRGALGLADPAVWAAVHGGSCPEAPHAPEMAQALHLPPQAADKKTLSAITVSSAL